MATHKPSRPSGEAMTNDLLGQEVVRWFRQLRRLQSLWHASNAGKTSEAALEYLRSFWKAISQATGFENGFHGWWKKPTRSVAWQS